MKFLTLFFVSAFAVASIFTTVSLARETSSGHALSTAAGVAAPSPALALDQDNPAGLAQVGGTQMVGALYSGNSSLSPLEFEGKLMFGNGSAGIGLGANTDSSFMIGAAAQIEALHTAFGVRATNNSGWGIDLGLNFLPTDSLRFGFELYDLGGGIDTMSAGVGFRLGANATFAVDAGFDKNFGGAVLKPGVSVDVEKAQFMMAYGFEVATAQASRVSTGLSFGLGFQLSQKMLLQYYYKHIALHYLALQVAL